MATTIVVNNMNECPALQPKYARKPKPSVVIPPAKPSMPSMKLYRLVIHSKNNTLTGTANQPSSTVLMAGIGKEYRVNPTPHTTITAASVCTARRIPTGSPALSLRNDMVVTSALEPMIQKLADARPFGRTSIGCGVTANPIATTANPIMTLERIATPPEGGVGSTWRDRSFG